MRKLSQNRRTLSRVRKRREIDGPRERYALQPAERIINQIFDGPPALSLELKVHKSTLYRCLKPKSAGGTDGEVPPKLQKKMLDLARKLGKPLSGNDFHSKD